ncbi:unnamed protein product, partial [Brassica napus]
WQSIKAIQGFVILLPSYLCHRFHTIYIYIYIYMESKAGIRKSHWFSLSPLQNSLLVVSGDCFHECPPLLARNVKEGGELMGIDMIMVHEKVSSIKLPHLDLIRQSLRRKRRKTWQEVLILLNIEGCVTVWRDYHGDVFAAKAERFFSKLIEKEVFLFRFHLWPSEKVVVIYSQMGSLTSTHNCNTGSLLRHTHNYLAFKSLNIIYALLDEMTDFGYPQYMEARILNGSYTKTSYGCHKFSLEGEKGYSTIGTKDKEGSKQK